MLARLLDISQAGCRLSTQSPLVANGVVWRKLPMIEAQSAQVVWTRGFEAGCTFDQPLHLAIFQVIRQQLKRR